MERHACITMCYEIPGQMWPSELCWLYDTFQASKLHLEVGTYCGRSLFASSGGMAPDAKLVVVDDNCGGYSLDWTLAVRKATFKLIPQNIEMLEKASVTALLECFNRGLRFDSIFVDADHNYAECKADIEACLPLLKSGGIISGHDYWSGNVGVMCAVQDVFKDGFELVPKTRIWHARSK